MESFRDYIAYVWTIESEHITDSII